MTLLVALRFRTVMTALALLAGLLCAPVQAGQERRSQPDLARFADYRLMRALEMRLVAVGYRLATTNAPLCEQQTGATGMLLYDAAQYDETGRAALDLGDDMVVAGLVPGSPAALAGIEAGDALTHIGDAAIAPLSEGAEQSAARHDAVLDRLARHDSAAPLPLGLTRKDAAHNVTLRPVPACASWFRLGLDNGMGGNADGQRVTINIGSVQWAESETALAALTAHELAHNILRHRERLDALGVRWGLLRGIGKNARHFRAAEAEADRLSIWLLANAGYDVEEALRVWTRFGKEHGLGLLASPTHPRWKERIAMMREEQGKILTALMTNGVRIPALPGRGPCAVGKACLYGGDDYFAGAQQMNAHRTKGDERP